MDASQAGQEIMTLSETAEYLQLAERTVLRMAQRGEIPAAKVASQWRFIRPLVREWLIARMQSLPSSSEVSGRPEKHFLPLVEVLRPELMTFDIQPGPKEDIFRQLVAPLLKTGFARNADHLLKSLVERERMMTTAIGHGIAVPHPRNPIADMFPEPAIAMGVCPRGTDFNAIDDQLVHVFFLICATRIEIHLQLMAGISWLSKQDVIMKLRGVSSPSEAIALLSAADAVSG